MTYSRGQSCEDSTSHPPGEDGMGASLHLGAPLEFQSLRRPAVHQGLAQNTPFNCLRIQL